MVPQDPLFAAQYVPQLLGVPRVWDIPQRRTPHLGLIDTPVLETHPDLNPINHIGDHGDPSGHGTELAGIMVAERDNQEGIAGLCDGSLSVAPLTSSSPTATDLAESVDMLRRKDCDVVCLPYRGSINDELTAAIETAAAEDTLIVTVAGNGSTTFARHTGNHDRVLCVGALTRSLSPALFSKLGGVDIFAPGTDVLVPTTGSDAYVKASGTSHACAVVAGIAGVVHARTTLTGEQLKAHLETTAAELPVSRQLQQGHAPEQLTVVRPRVKNQKEQSGFEKPN